MATSSPPAVPLIKPKFQIHRSLHTRGRPCRRGVHAELDALHGTWRWYAGPLHCSAKPARPCPLAAPPGARRATEASDGREADAAPARRSRSKSSTRSRAPPRRPPRARPTARARACPRPPESSRTRCTVCRWRRTARGPLALDKQYARDRVRCRAARPDRASPPARDRACPYRPPGPARPRPRLCSVRLQLAADRYRVSVLC